MSIPLRLALMRCRRARGKRKSTNHLTQLIYVSQFSYDSYAIHAPSWAIDL